MDTICPKQLEKFIYLRTNGQQEIVQSLPLLATTWDWHSQCLQKQLGVLGYPIGIILDNGQALIDDDLSNYTKLWIVPEKSTYLMERFLISNVISI